MWLSKISAAWLRIKNQYGHRRVVALAYLLIIGVVSLTIHVLFVGGLGHSSLLYMLVPYGVSLLIAAMRSDKPANSNASNYFRHIGTALLIFLASSVVLREGFICIVFFFPIYFIVVSIAYAFRIRKTAKNKIHSMSFPVVMLLMSMEGTSSLLTFDRDASIQVSQITSLSVEEIKANLAKPMDLNKQRHWMLSIFPMPYQIEAASLKPGDVHKIKTRYQRWFFTNTHEGEAELLISNVGASTIRTKLLSDTTYFSSYLKLYGTKIDLEPVVTGGTKITFQIDYERKLDPAWYFQPVQKFGVTKMAEFLINEVMIRDDSR